MPSQHARVGASSLHRTLRCPGSVYMAEFSPQDRDSEVAAEGTVAHYVRETALEFGLGLEDFLGDTLSADGFEFTVGQDMVDALAPGVEWIEERPGDVVIEMQVTSGDEMPGQFGTLDCGITAPDLITINDLKYGQGVPVSAEENEQLMAYALWFWENYARYQTEATDVLLVIDQPRVEGGWSEWETDIDRLLEFKETLRESFDVIFLPEDRVGDVDDWIANPDAPLHAGDKQCMFCPAKGWCPELARHCLEVAQQTFDDLDDVIEGGELTVANAHDLTPERRSVVVKNTELFNKWLREVRAYTLSQALAGEPTPGLKAVSGRRSAKRWADEKKAKKFLRKHLDKAGMYAPRTLITPTQAESLIPQSEHDRLEQLWTQDEGKPSLVDEAHKKPAITLADKFED